MSRAGMFTITPQERKISVPVSSRSAFPQSCTKFAFPRARVPKMPGTRERGSARARERKSRNARPPLALSLNNVMVLSSRVVSEKRPTCVCEH